MLNLDVDEVTELVELLTSVEGRLSRTLERDQSWRPLYRMAHDWCVCDRLLPRLRDELLRMPSPARELINHQGTKGGFQWK